MMATKEFRMKIRFSMLFGIFFLPVVFGCVSEKMFDEMSQRFERERSKNETLVKEIELLKQSSGLLGEDAAAFKTREEELLAKIKSLSSSKKGVRTIVKEVVKFKTADMSWAKGVSAMIKSAFQDELRSGKIQLKLTKDRLKIILLEPVLFEPDDVRLTLDGEDILARLGEVLGKVPNRPIAIGAHLDNQPIAPVMAAEFPTAWDFTAARAVDVLRFLQEESKISGKVLSGVAYGAARPVASNSNDSGRAKNRRIEISLLG